MITLKLPTKLVDAYLVRDKAEGYFSIWLGRKEDLIYPGDRGEWSNRPIRDNELGWYYLPYQEVTELSKEEVLSMGIMGKELPKPGRCKKIKFELVEIF